MKPNRRPACLFVVAACALGILPVLAQTSSPPIELTASPTAITAAGAREDLELAISAVEAALPDVHWHQTRRAWATAKAEAREQVAAVQDSEGLWRTLRPLLAQIGEGHLSVRLSEAMSRGYHDAARFPLDILWSEQGAFVLAGYGAAADVPKGARLVSVDGVGAEALLRELVSVIAHDGIVRTGAMRQASGRDFAAFLFRLRGPQASFRVAFDGPGGRIERELAAVPRLARPPEADDPSPLPTLEWIDRDTAYLNVPTFSNRRLRAASTTFPEEIHERFVELAQRRAANLILDLRENGGGSEPNEAILFSYLAQKRLRRYAAVEARGRHIAVTSLSGKRFETEVFDEDEMAQQRPIGGGRLTRRNVAPEGLMSRWRSYAPVYRGRLVILAGGNTFSGGAELASMLFHVRRGVFVGEEVAGTHEGNTSGHSWSLELPNSGMKLSIPLLQFRMAWRGLPHGRGVRPDCPVPPEVAEYGVRRDRAWRVALAILRGRWRTPEQAQCPAAIG